jgi:hypothetical protein
MKKWFTTAFYFLLVDMTNSITLSNIAYFLIESPKVQEKILTELDQKLKGIKPD